MIGWRPSALGSFRSLRVLECLSSSSYRIFLRNVRHPERSRCSGGARDLRMQRAVAREIPRPARKDAGLRDDARMFETLSLGNDDVPREFPKFAAKKGLGCFQSSEGFSQAISRRNVPA